MNNRDNSTELIEEWDWERAVPTGKAVPRGEAHKKGIAHEGVHLWVIRKKGKIPEILFQHRAKSKEIYPDCLDITVGGHVPYSIKENKIQKEAGEEIGIAPQDSDLADLGYYRYEEKEDNLFHREFQRVYLYIDNRPLDKYTFNDGEVEGIYAVPLNYLEEILKDDKDIIIEGFNGEKIIELKASRRNFHPLLFSHTMDIYMNVVITGIKELISFGTVKTKMPPPI